MCPIGQMVFTPLVQALKQKRGFWYTTIIDLPSGNETETGAPLEPSGLHNDVAAVHGAVERCLSANENVVRTGHSYGGSWALYGISIYSKLVQITEPKCSTDHRPNQPLETGRENCLRVCLSREKRFQVIDSDRHILTVQTVLLLKQSAKHAVACRTEPNIQYNTQRYTPTHSYLYATIRAWIWQSSSTKLLENGI